MLPKWCHPRIFLFLPIEALMIHISEYVIKLIPSLVTFRSKEWQILTRFTYNMGKADLSLILVEIRHFLQNSNRVYQCNKSSWQRASVPQNLYVQGSAFYTISQRKVTIFSVTSWRLGDSCLTTVFTTIQIDCVIFTFIYLFFYLIKQSLPPLLNDNLK